MPCHSDTKNVVIVFLKPCFELIINVFSFCTFYGKWSCIYVVHGNEKFTVKIFCYYDIAENICNKVLMFFVLLEQVML